jgi:trehalose utilization protein
MKAIGNFNHINNVFHDGVTMSNGATRMKLAYLIPTKNTYPNVTAYLIKRVFKSGCLLIVA